MGYIKGEERTQMILFPESIDDYIHEDNPVRIIDAFVEQLDMVELAFERSISPTFGRPPYAPRSY